ncbi:hypothetical protein KO507_17040 [Gilvimarinus agarilyticus]|nr:hypothetical protein [Gilvimarinus agarilyticus]
MFLGQYTKDSKRRVVSGIQRAYRDNLTPEMVLFVYPNYLKSEVESLMEDDSVRIDVTRHTCSAIYGVSFDENARLRVRKAYKDGPPGVKLNGDTLFEDLASSGLDALMAKRVNDVIVKSPAGTTFVKPSGQALEEFIYASQLARCNFENQFIAMCLLRHAPDAQSIDTIYIDTFSISSIAEAVVYYLKQFLNIPCKHIDYRSFSSYSGLEESFRPDNVKGTWVIISASASTSMGRRLVKEWGIIPSQVVTILSYKDCLKDDDRNDGNAVVFCVEKYSSREGKNFSPTKVQVQGESFSAEVSTPDKVALLKKHKPLYIDDSVFRFYSGDVFSVNRHDRTLYVDYVELRKSYEGGGGELDREADLYKWIRQVVEWTVPRSLSTIIYCSDPASVQLVDDFKSVLKQCGFDVDNLRVINESSQSAMDDIKDSAVLVLSPAITTAHVFVDVNRSLRLAKHTGMRTFATPFVVSPSKSQFESVNKSLTQGVGGFKYHFVKFKKLYLNGKYVSPWERELDVIKDLLNGEADDSELFWVERKSQLERRSVGLKSKVGIHCTSPRKDLEIANDFVFWPDGYSVGDINYSSVFATIGCILQNLRDNCIDGVQLSGNIYKHSVLDPENFIRFNDPIIQSCLWRCALPGELDYRRSDVLSGEMTRILIKIFKASGSERGVTSLDLLMGIATRWIKISSSEMTKIIDSAESYLIKPHEKLLINYLKGELSEMQR